MKWNSKNENGGQEWVFNYLLGANSICPLPLPTTFMHEQTMSITNLTTVATSL